MVGERLDDLEDVVGPALVVGAVSVAEPPLGNQLAQLLALGCGFGQGFYLAKPMDAIDLEALLDRPAAAALNGNAAGNGAVPKHGLSLSQR